MTPSLSGSPGSPPQTSQASQASPQPLDAPTPGDDGRLPKGHCRYILTVPGIKGHRCACVSFVHNTNLPGATCDCGHLSCFHVLTAEEPSPASNRQELELLKQRIQQLEAQNDLDQPNGWNNILARVSQLEEIVERGREEMSTEIKASYNNIAGAWGVVEQLHKRVSGFEEIFRIQSEQLSRAGKELSDLRNRHLELLDSDESLEERIEKLESAATATPTITPFVPHGNTRKTLPSHPINPPTDTVRLTPSSNSVAHHHGGAVNAISPLPKPLTLPPAAFSTPTESWTVHISLLPSAKYATPFEKDSTAYKRCLSRGLHKMVAVEGRDGQSFTSAVTRAFKDLLRGHSWMPLQVKGRDGHGHQGKPLLKPLEPVSLSRTYDFDFLRHNCAVCDEKGRMESMYIAPHGHDLSWSFLRQCPAHLDGLEGSWAHDAHLDAGDERGLYQPKLPTPPETSHSDTSTSSTFKRSAAEMSRVASLTSTVAAMHEAEGSRNKVPRTCMSGRIEVRRGLGTAS
ncbi:hypothetical protein B0I35DRAFT_439956 [Stachybotrys elegans]|uniref:Uncharacterized protein n=1 Tax=Stachybotrys elegans TaxID=80388 RepID=A0A8K0WMV9_9HYPO|nr:hypothetical protein B0I35DRAFT_439956 [Stachybotrys elegans]